MTTSPEPILECEGLKQYFSKDKSLGDMLRRRDPQQVKAVDGVDLEIDPGEIVGIAGESGCGKTTLGKTLIRLLDPTEGTIRFEGEDISDYSSRNLTEFRKEVQVIFQDPFESLNPRRKILDIVQEPLVVHDIGDREERERRVKEALSQAELHPPEQFLDRFPHQLSGGEKQRVAIARALILEPKFILCDEPVSMLDVSVRAGILNLLQKINDEFDITLLFISHDLSLLRHVCERVGIMYLGRIVEIGETESMIQDPVHPYSKALIESAPEPDPRMDPKRDIAISGSIPDPIDLPEGCRFKDRCPDRRAVCDQISPPLLPIEGGKRVACHPYYDESDREEMAERYHEQGGTGDPLEEQ